MKEKEKEKHKKESVIVLYRTLFTGFIGGLLCSFSWVILYYFNFSEVSPKNLLLSSWLTAEWASRWLGDIVAILIVGMLSVLAALIYYGFLKKVYSMWAGVAYGIFLWVVIFYLFQPLFINIPSLTDYNQTTIISTISLFVLYGTFIGYSISYDYNDTIIE